MAKRKTINRRPVVGNPNDPNSLPGLAKQYFEWMKVNNYSEHTIKGRQAYLHYFIAWCDERDITKPAEVTKPILERYQRYVYYRKTKSGKPLSFRGQNAQLVPVRMFFKWLAQGNHIIFNPAADLTLPRMEKRLPKHVLTESEVEQVLSQPNTKEFLGIRDRAMMETFYSTGMRRSELTNLTLYDMDIERGTVVIRQGKGKKDRMIPIGDRAAIWIEKYLTQVRPTLAGEADNGTVFLTLQGEVFNPTSLSTLIREYVDRADTGKTGSCHLFRHTMATLMLENGADIRYIQEMLGHADLSTTEIYTRVSIKKLMEVHSRTHPAKVERGESGDDEVQRAREALLEALDAEGEE